MSRAWENDLLFSSLQILFFVLFCFVFILFFFVVVLLAACSSIYTLKEVPRARTSGLSWFLVSKTLWDTGVSVESRRLD